MTTGTCPSLGALLAAHESARDRDVDPAVLAHLHGCAVCRVAVQRATIVLAMHRDAANQQTRMRVAQGRERLRAALDESERRWAWGVSRQQLLRWLPMTAGVVLAVTASFFVMSTPTSAASWLARAAAAERRLAAEPTPRVRVMMAPTPGHRDAARAPFTSWVGVLGEDELPPAIQRLIDRYTDVLPHARDGAAGPLSVATCKAWRRTLPGRRETVVHRGARVIVRIWSDTNDVLKGVELILGPDVQPRGVTLIAADYRVELEPLPPATPRALRPLSK